MKIAVTSQNRRTITGHAGRCRKFWIYDVSGGAVIDKALRELAMEETFRESHPDAPHPLDDVSALITAGMGEGLKQRLDAKGVQWSVTDETDPDQAVRHFLQAQW